MKSNESVHILGADLSAAQACIPNGKTLAVGIIAARATNLIIGARARLDSNDCDLGTPRQAIPRIGLPRGHDVPFVGVADVRVGHFQIKNPGAETDRVSCTVPSPAREPFHHRRDAVAVSLGQGSNDAAWVPVPPFLSQTLIATISDNSAVMFVARYTSGPLKLYAGYEHIEYMAPSDPQTAFTDISGTFLCQGCAAINNTTINNAAFGANGLGNKIFQVVWTGAKYTITNDLDVVAAYYRYIQDSYFGTPAGGQATCSGSQHAQCAGTSDAISGVIDWRFAPKWDLYLGAMFSQVNGGLANEFLKHNNVDPTVGLRFRF